MSCGPWCVPSSYIWHPECSRSSSHWSSGMRTEWVLMVLVAGVSLHGGACCVWLEQVAEGFLRPSPHIQLTNPWALATRQVCVVHRSRFSETTCIRSCPWLIHLATKVGTLVSPIFWPFSKTPQISACFYYTNFGVVTNVRKELLKPEISSWPNLLRGLGEVKPLRISDKATVKCTCISSEESEYSPNVIMYTLW